MESLSTPALVWSGLRAGLPSAVLSVSDEAVSMYCLAEVIARFLWWIWVWNSASEPVPIWSQAWFWKFTGLELGSERERWGVWLVLFLGLVDFVVNSDYPASSEVAMSPELLVLCPLVLWVWSQVTVMGCFVSIAVLFSTSVVPIFLFLFRSLSA